MILLNKESMRAFLDEKALDITIVKSIDSTNNFFEAHTPSDKISVCFAEQQTQGRGQFQRVWHSPFSENIYCSFCYFSKQPPMMLSSLSLVMGYAVCAVLNTFFVLEEPALIKWPNDIIHRNSKISGVLIETKKMSDESYRVVIGIGLNVNMQPSQSHSISQPWTSLIELTGTLHDRNFVSAKLINQVLMSIRLFEKEGFFPFASKWNNYNALLNKTVQLRHNQKISIGKCIGLSSQGELMLELFNGKIEKFLSGEASLQ